MSLFLQTRRWWHLRYYNEEAEIHGHWVGIPGSWLNKQISDHSTWITAWFAAFLVYTLECSECYLLPQFLRYHVIPYLYVQTTYYLFTNISVYLYQQAVTSVLTWPVKPWLHPAMCSWLILNFILIFPNIYCLLLFLVWKDCSSYVWTKEKKHNFYWHKKFLELFIVLRNYVILYKYYKWILMVLGIVSMKDLSHIDGAFLLIGYTLKSLQCLIMIFTSVASF